MSCITMEVDSEGFWYPVVDHIRCVQCDLCTEVCPIVGSTTQSELGKSLPEAYAAYNIDERLRLQSSSGGLFTLLGEMVINSGGVVFGARFDDDFNVIHDYVETSEDLYRLRGSKYVQSLIGDTFKQAQEFLECDRLVMFTGTPLPDRWVKTLSRTGIRFSNLSRYRLSRCSQPKSMAEIRYLSWAFCCFSHTRNQFQKKRSGVEAVFSIILV